MKPPVIAAAAVLLFLGAAAADLGLRSRSALLEARRQETWVKEPALKKAYYEAVLAKALAAVEKDAAAGRLDRPGADRKKALLTAERDFNMAESPAKLAWLWYRTAAREFPSPLNPWAAEAARALPAARAAWKAELAAKGIPPKDWMLPE